MATVFMKKLNSSLDTNRWLTPAASALSKLYKYQECIMPACEWQREDKKLVYLSLLILGWLASELPGLAARLSNGKPDDQDD